MSYFYTDPGLPDGAVAVRSMVMSDMLTGPLYVVINNRPVNQRPVRTMENHRVIRHAEPITYWIDKPLYADAERDHYEKLARKNKNK